MFTVQVKANTQVAKMLRLVDCRKRKMLVSFVSPGMRETAPGWWDGGSREEQMRVEYYSHNNLMVHHAPQITNPFTFNQNRFKGFPKVEIDDGQALLSVGTFCGKPRTPHLLCTEDYWYKLFAK